jgi:NADH-quinone oxidoreductase subunit N
MRQYSMFIPEYIAAGSAVGIIALELAFPKLRREFLGYLTALAGIAWAVAASFYIGKHDHSYQGLLQTDNFTTYFRMLAGGIIAITGLLSATYMKDKAKTASEYYGLLLTAGLGMVFMAASRVLITAYISLELVSFSLYFLVGYLK